MMIQRCCGHSRLTLSASQRAADVHLKSFLLYGKRILEAHTSSRVEYSTNSLISESDGTVPTNTYVHYSPSSEAIQLVLQEVQL
jgi:hypothetical protein